MFKKYYDEYSDNLNKGLEKTGVFWAFNKEQFNENKTHKNAPDDEYLSIGDGGYIHKSNKKNFDNFFKKIVPKLKEDLKSKINIDDLIEYVLENHECYYINDYTEVVIIVHDFYKELPIPDIVNKVKNVFNSTKDKHLSNYDLEETNIGI